ncbi:MAG TPA: hypothetical protein VEC39_12095 [Vicinamibacterales bacterium]|nr:hypothetical protein [Vicinamibacterales bacterium]
MTFSQQKLLVLSVWSAAVMLLGYAFTANTPAAWGMVTTLAIAPPMIALWFWQPPLVTIAQPIQAARR